MERGPQRDRLPDRPPRRTTFSTYATLPGNATTFADNTVSPLGEYYYRVVGINSLTQGVEAPAPWRSQDVGAMAGSGAVGLANGQFTVVANGNDIWNAADQMRFTYAGLVGDGQIVARVSGVENTDGWAKAGVMIRESLAANARHAFTAVSATNAPSRSCGLPPAGPRPPSRRPGGSRRTG